ncbi:xanthine dehydrogenase family protein molybdopterin-binding subunit [Rhodoplanes roseus]|uniref:Xanthine dehydrogenase n=1 Tax=Rhodoplanes roseus TaxID=29409 RepID=A0A327KV48_9BRAD|nr:xanthine dehydrogenase family protein molybdopterin-binding subunit [Rhodoplanes roseus]RAI42151.1 xanthine dehydrogenase [Rhodoplanes roseus]
MSIAAPEPKANMGRPEPRLDARLKVTGEARYPSDVPVGNPLHAVLVTSAIAKGRLDRLDTEAARAVPGVVEIFTAENTRELKPLEYTPGGGGASTSVQGLGPDIAHDGQIIAMVVAESFEVAREAAYKVKATYAREAPSASFGAAGLDEKPAGKEFPKAGDAAAALSAADVVVDAEYGTPTQHHNPIELFTTTCVWDGEHLTVHEPSQFVYGLKNSVAKRLGIDPAKVRVVSTYIGGAFGSKAQLTPRTPLVALAAKRLGRPVKLVASRDQGFTIATYRAETKHRIRLGARRDGKITAYTHDGREVTSRPDAYKVAGVSDTVRLYDFGTVATSVNVVHADRNTPGFMRSPPVVPYVYALESAMDELAVALGMDPVELRRINDVTKDTVSGKSWSSRSLMKCYDEAAAAFGWSRRTAEPGSMRDGEWLVGWGCATACYPTHMAATTARVRLLPSGEVRVQVAAHDIGTGAYTVIGQTAAERLGVPLAAVTVELGDSDLPPGPVAGGSTTTASTCSAVIKACDAIREKLVRAASTANDGPLAGRSPSDLSFTDGRAVASDGAAESVADVMQRLGTAALEEYAEYIPHGVQQDGIRKLYSGRAAMTGGPHGDKIMYALGAEFVEVRVHARTREVRVPRAVGAFAGGRILNPRTAHSQLMGGMIWGIGSALHEATEIDPREARYVNDNISEYLIPVNADVPRIDVIMVPEEDAEVNPAGVKGLGELGNVGTAAAIANAVYHATGKRIRDLPIRIEDLL